MSEENKNKTQPKNEFLKKFSKDNEKKNYKKKRDLLDGYKFKDSQEIPLTQYTKMVCTLYESESREGLYRVEMKIGYNRVVFDGNLLFVVAEYLKELGSSFVPADLRPKEGSS